MKGSWEDPAVPGKPAGFRLNRWENRGSVSLDCGILEKKEWGGREGRECQPMKVCSIFTVPWHLGHFLLFVE
jgi:hypothetical protein